MVNIGFLGAFRGLKDQFPAKYHISGHYGTEYRFLKNRIFFLRFFFDVFLDFVNLIRGRDRPEVAGPINYCPSGQMGRSKLEVKKLDF